MSSPVLRWAICSLVIFSLISLSARSLISLSARSLHSLSSLSLFSLHLTSSFLSKCPSRLLSRNTSAFHSKKGRWPTYQTVHLIFHNVSIIKVRNIKAPTSSLLPSALAFLHFLYLFSRTTTAHLHFLVLARFRSTYDSTDMSLVAEAMR